MAGHAGKRSQDHDCILGHFFGVVDDVSEPLNILFRMPDSSVENVLVGLRLEIRMLLCCLIDALCHCDLAVFHQHVSEVHEKSLSVVGAISEFQQALL